LWGIPPNLTQEEGVRGWDGEVGVSGGEVGAKGVKAITVNSFKILYLFSGLSPHHLIYSLRGSCMAR